MKYCSNCGNQINENDTFCSKCGHKKEHTIITRTNIPKRDIAIQIILSILTCGLYLFYWVITITDDINALNEEKNLSGGATVLLIILTCGLYSIYWAYDMSKKLYNLGLKYNVTIQDNSILCLILSICGFNFINYFILQSDLNKFAN